MSSGTAATSSNGHMTRAMSAATSTATLKSGDFLTHGVPELPDKPFAGKLDFTLPDDPRNWSREHVAQWIRQIASRHSLPTIPSERFLMNGKALCLMNMDMFVQRVPLGGKLLYKDFQIRLHQAMYRCSR